MIEGAGPKMTLDAAKIFEARYFPIFSSPDEF
jgi:hypothetical protein